MISRTMAPLIYVPSITTSFGAAALGEVTTAANAGRAGVSETCGLGDIIKHSISRRRRQRVHLGRGSFLRFADCDSPHHRVGQIQHRSGGGGIGHAETVGYRPSCPPPVLSGRPQGARHVNQTFLRPFVNYNMPDGWYLVGSPVITANWSANGSQRWNVPIGGGLGKIFKIEGQPINPSS
jgi:hypothetical protein